jgi:HK97 gp10 family phage protein
LGFLSLVVLTFLNPVGDCQNRAAKNDAKSNDANPFNVFHETSFSQFSENHGIIHEMPVKILGVAQFQTTLKTLDIAIRHAALGEIVLEASRPILDDARRTVFAQSTRSGDLARGLAMEMQQPKTAQSHEAVVHIGADRKQFYGRFVELGTVHAKAEAFLVPALESNRSRVIQTIQDRLLKSIERIAGGERPGGPK